jgi:ADP-heptose:LPS heptosyltransferase
VGEIVFTPGEEAYGQRYANRIILEPHIKGKASPNKQWSWIRWSKLAWMMQNKGLRVSQVGPGNTQTLERSELIVCPDFRHAAAVLKYARAAVLPEGGLHHAAAAVGLPAVVLFGGFTPLECTGYEGHINIGASGTDACGMRTLCEHCERWMAAIKPEMVFDHLQGILSDRQRVNRDATTVTA